MRVGGRRESEGGRDSGSKGVRMGERAGGRGGSEGVRSMCMSLIKSA